MARTDVLTIPKIANEITTDGDAYAFLEKLRWGSNLEGLSCPHCGHDSAYFLNPENGKDRKTRTGNNSQRRVWKCKACRKQFSVTTGTIFHGSKISLRTWVLVIFQMCSSKNGVAAKEIERTYGVTMKSAWFMLHRIREAMKLDPLAGMLTGTIVADETFIGGKPANRHRQGKTPGNTGGGRGKAGRSSTKVPVLTLVNKETGEARSTVVADVTGATLGKVIADHVNIGESVLHTDAGKQYRPLGQEFIAHEWVDHSEWEYVRNNVSTNMAEGFFSQLKRSLDGTHHHVSTRHLPRYLAEFDFRYTHRKLSDSARTYKLMEQVGGKRLTYKPLVTGQ
jgi:transposase-like protein